MMRACVAFSICVLAATLVLSQETPPHVIKIRAEGTQDGNPPSHVLDTSAETRWSAEGAGRWLAVEFQEPASFDRIEIGFLRGERRYGFALEVSIEGKSWETLSSFTSSGKGDALETFTFEKTRAKHWRILSAGSNANAWMNIHTLKFPNATVDAKLVEIAPPPGVAGTGFVVEEFAKSGMVGSCVGISVDRQGRVYVAQTTRRNNGALDIRRNSSWLVESLASRSVEDKRAMIRKRKKDWPTLFEFRETIIRLEDHDGDGQADDRRELFSGLNSEVHGLAGGVLEHEGHLYVTCIPSFYKLSDSNSDGQFDVEAELVRGFGSQVGYGGHDMHGPTLGPDGRIYWSIGDKGITVRKDGKEWIYPGQGGVMRIETDGTGFEVFANGLRNPQELAFDEFGNLFTVDNDGDFGDAERVHFVVEGTDSGWRANYQYRNNRRWSAVSGYNPWLADGLYKPYFESQPAYITPSIANFSAGPIGLEYNPGTALGVKYRGHFFLAESNMQMQAFRVEPAGAGFRMLKPEVVLRGPFTIGVRFGPDGALYLADWGKNPWAPHLNGRVLKLDVPSSQRDPLRATTAKYLAADESKLSESELVSLLGYADQRVRLVAQFELVRRGAIGARALLSEALGETKSATEIAEQRDAQLARIHAIWGLGQLGRRDSKVLVPVVSLLSDADADLRVQAIRVIGDARLLSAADAVVECLKDSEARVRLAAGVALRSLAEPRHLANVVSFIESIDASDPFLRHAAVMALEGCGTEAAWSVSRHRSPRARQIAVVVMRRLGDARIANLLNDADDRVASEAARAIHDDFSIPAALPSLARRLESPSRSEPLLRRAISANQRVGGEASALRLAEFAAHAKADEKLRALALSTLATWTSPSPLDSVQGFYREPRPQSADDARAALDRTIGDLLASDSDLVRSETAKLIRLLEYGDAAARVTAMTFDASLPPTVRSSTLRAMHALSAKRIDEAVNSALNSEGDSLRHAAIEILAERSPASEALQSALTAALASEESGDRQHALRVLTGLTNSRARALVASRLEQFLAGKGSQEEALELYGAAAMSTELKKKIEAKLPRDEGPFALATYGGDPVRGEKIFRTSSTAQCSRCHHVGPAESSNSPGVGPNLSGIAKKRDREFLRRSVVLPSQDIEESYRSFVFVLVSGDVVTGTKVSESGSSLEVAQSSGEIRKLRKRDIVKESEQKSSIMPDFRETLSPYEVRDIVAYLASLTSAPSAPQTSVRD